MVKKIGVLIVLVVLSISISAISVSAVCGDGVMDPGEACDDGNFIHGDGCDATCNLEYASELILNASDKINEINTTLQDKDSFKADVSNLATQDNISDQNTKLDSIQADLDSPDQYKADVSNLATLDNISSITNRLDDGSFGLQAIRNLVQTVINDIFDFRSEVQQNVSVIQADLDNPDQYKADTSGLASAANLTNVATQTSVDALQVDLDNPDQYKADTTNLATQDNITDLKTQLETKASQSSITTLQNDLDNPDQYKADTSNLATQSDIALLATQLNITLLEELIKAKSNQSTVDWIHMQVDNDSRYVDDEELAAALATLAAQSIVDEIQKAVNNTDQYKADVTGLATSSDITALEANLDGLATQDNVTSVNNRLDDGSFGLQAIRNLVQTVINDVFDLTALTRDNMTTIRNELNTVQTDLDNPDQYKADVTGLATQTNVTMLYNQISAKASQATVDWIHMQVDNNSRYVDDEELAAALAAIATQASIDMLKSMLNNTDQYKADVSELATQLSVDNLQNTLDNLDINLSNLDVPVSSRASEDAVAAVQADLDNPEQYKANISSLATLQSIISVEDEVASRASQESVDWIHMQVDNNSRYIDDEEFATALLDLATSQDLIDVLDAIDALDLDTSHLATQTNISLLEALIATRASQSTVDWIHMQVDNDSRYVDDEELAAAISGLATQTTVQMIKDIVNNTDQFKTDTTDLATQLSVDEIKAAVDLLNLSNLENLDALVSSRATQTSVDAVQADLDNPDQYKADVTGLATSSDILALQTNLDDLATQTNVTMLYNQISAKASQATVDWIHMQVDNNSRYIDDEEFASAIAGLAAQTTVDMIKAMVNNTDQYKADTTNLATQLSVDNVLAAINLLNLTNLEKLDVAVSTRASQSSVDALQADLDNPDQYKADISNLADKDTVDWIHMQVDNNSRYVDDEEFTTAITGLATQTSVDNLQTTLDNLNLNVDVSNLATQDNISMVKSQLAALQQDLDNPDQYKADVSGLADQTTVNEIQTTVESIETKIDNLDITNLDRLDVNVSSRASQQSIDDLLAVVQTRASQTSADNLQATADWIHMQVDNDSRYVDDEELLAALAGIATQSSVDSLQAAVDLLNLSNLENLDALVSSRASQQTVDMIKAMLNNTDQYKADVSNLADKDTVDWIHMQVDNDSRYVDDEELANAIAGLATQTTADSIESKIDALDITNLQKLDVNVSTRASQASVDALQTTLDNPGFGLGAITGFITQIIGLTTDTNNILNNGDNFVDDAELESALAQIDPMLNCDVCKKLDDIMMNISSLRGFNKANFDFLTTNSQEILTGVESTENKVDDVDDDIEALNSRITDLEDKLDQILLLLDNSQSVCGDGNIEGIEQCDDGNNINGDGCSNVCKTEFCGDGTLQQNLGEQCDDGNSADGDGCSASCQLEQQAVCGNGVEEAGEECDLGAANGDICTPQYGSSCDFCTNSCEENTVQGGVCGDNLVNGPEQCDDGNTDIGDGCNVQCQTEECQTDADCPADHTCNAQFVCEQNPPQGGNVIFRTNVVEGEYFACLKYDECWIAVDFDQDGDLEALAFEQKSDLCDGGEKIVETPEGYDVYKYGHEYRVRLCDNENRQTIFDLRVATNDLELSGAPTEPFASNGQESYS